MYGFHVTRDWSGESLGAAVEAAAAGTGQLAPGRQLAAAQVFIAGPRQRKMLLDAAGEQALARAASERWVCAHGTYMDAPWADTPGARHARKFIRQELAVCDRTGLRGLVIHLGKTPPARVAEVLPELIGRPGARAGRARLYLELPAVKPANSHYESPEKVAALFRAVRASADPDLEAVGLCVDTAHIWASGADIASAPAARRWLDGLERAGVPPEAIMFHLNDNRHPQGSGRDEHNVLGRGAIWSPPGADGLAPFAEYLARHEIPTILERKKRTTHDALKADLMLDFAALDDALSGQ